MAVAQKSVAGLGYTSKYATDTFNDLWHWSVAWSSRAVAWDGEIVSVVGTLRKWPVGEIRHAFSAHFHLQ